MVCPADAVYPIDEAGNTMHDHVKMVMDWISGLLSLAAFIQLINWLLALPAAFYMCIRIYESKTVQGWLAKRRARHNPL